jgi:hypothetical protein
LQPQLGRLADPAVLEHQKFEGLAVTTEARKAYIQEIYERRSCGH